MKIYFPTIQNFHEKELEELCDLINRVYFATESSLIDPNIQRTTLSDLKTIISKKELVIAEFHNTIIGCVHVKMIDKETMMFGMLVAHPDYRSQGIGKKLVSFVEGYVNTQGYKKICLELLTPKNWVHEQKEFLKSWYIRSGYEKQRIVPFNKEEHLITPCELTLYCKKLSGIGAVEKEDYV